MLDLIAYTNCSHSPTVEDAWQASDHGQSGSYTDLEFWTDLATRLERGGFTSLFFADAYNVANQYQESIAPTVRHGEQFPENDPLPLLSALAGVTDHLGLITTASASFYPPYLLAKKLSTIDDLTNGRLGWNVVTSAGDLEFENVVGDYVPHDERYERADEYLEVCYKLWEASWSPDSIKEDIESGTYADPDGVSFTNHAGEYFDIPGPHMCAPTPQRTPVIFQAGQSKRGREFAARHAEATFSFHLSREGFANYAEDLTDRAAAKGRTREEYNLYPAITPYVAPTEAEARATYDRVLDFIKPETGLVRLSNHLNHDYSQYDLDAPLEDIDVEGIRGALNAFIADNREWTVREAAIRYARYPAAELIGTPESMADELERWEEAGADGFVVMAPLVPRTFTDVADYLIPELRDRSLYPTEYESGQTLREQLLGSEATVAKNHPAQMIENQESE